MAAAYHMEALRKQRVIDRAHQARSKMNPELAEEQEDPMEKYFTRERPISGSGYLTSPSPPASQCQGRSSRQSAGGSRSTSRTPSSRDHTSSRARYSGGGSRSSSQASSHSHHDSRSGSRAMSRPGNPCPAEELTEEEQVQLDLLHKEKMLRDSNLVMGHISPREILLDRE